MLEPSIYYLMGPTCSGKTEVVLALAKELPIAIISVDSALIYRTMDIGTAKPSKAQLEAAPHQLIDIIDPSESYSVAQFCTDATTAIEQALNNKQIPLLVGGTMLYFNALKNGLNDLPPSDPELRADLNQKLKTEGLASLYHTLCRLDPAAKRLHQNDSQRILRALEVITLTGKPMNEFWQQSSNALPYDLKAYALMPTNREVLHQRIATRFNAMLADGFLDEARALFDRHDLTANHPSMRCVNYRQAWHYFKGDLTHDEMTQKAIIATRQLAKRQITWLRSFKDCHTLTTPLALKTELIRVMTRK